MDSSNQSPQSSRHQNDDKKTPYQQKISTLPKVEGWLTPEGNPYYLYQDFWYNNRFLEGLMTVQDTFTDAKPSDIVVSSSLKTGTTWLKALTFAILTRKQFLDPSENPLLGSVSHELIPFLEVDVAKKGRVDSLPLLSTHVPYSSLPKSIIDSGCKFIYICRDPKDVFISLWHFLRKLTMKQYEGIEPISLEKAFDMFCQGKSNYGPYWEHVLGYWNASLDHPEKILFLKYEDMMKEPRPYVKRLAEFMGLPFSMEEETQGEIGKIIETCSFGNMSNLKVNKSGNHRGSRTMENNVYFRKAEVGDWKNYLTKEMAEKLDHITSEKLHGTGLEL